jgi:hypothetical protein
MRYVPLRGATLKHDTDLPGGFVEARNTVAPGEFELQKSRLRSASSVGDPQMILDGLRAKQTDPRRPKVKRVGGARQHHASPAYPTQASVGIASDGRRSATEQRLSSGTECLKRLRNPPYRTFDRSRSSNYGSRGWEFESPRARHFLPCLPRVSGKTDPSRLSASSALPRYSHKRWHKAHIRTAWTRMW